MAGIDKKMTGIKAEAGRDVDDGVARNIGYFGNVAAVSDYDAMVCET